MARRRRSRRYGGMVTIPGLGFLPALKKSVNGSDVLVGAAAGVVGGQIVNSILAKGGVLAKLPAALIPYVPSITSILAGAALYYGQKKSARASGHLVGAFAAGVVSAIPPVKMALGMTTGEEAAVAIKPLSDVVSLKFSGYGYNNGYGVLVNEATPTVGPGGYHGYGGLIVDDPGRVMYPSQQQMSDANLSQLAGLSMGDDDESGLSDLMELDS